MGLATLLLFWSPVKALAPIGSDLNSKEGIQAYIALEASKNGLDASVPDRIVKLESNYQIGAVGDHGAAHCVAQFHEETFYRMQKASGENQMYKWGDERTCIRLLIWAFNNGYEREWTTYGR